uniref:Uncharacterized protein n=1 Tax=viral metagenome TaxID=1070528 RepID=A0A6M3J5A7_9ZZZZ
MAEKDIDQEFIEEFKRISQEHILRGYEEKNRDRIREASFMVKDAFDRQWTKITGNSYYQPVTTVTPPLPAFGQNNTQRTDPKSRRYMTTLGFTEIEWQKLRRRVGKKLRDLYNLKGIHNGSQRPIFQNLDSDRLKSVLGEKDAEKILKEKGDHGSIKGSFNLEVEGYWEVVFSPQKSEIDPIDVRLMWEGQCLIIKRQQNVVLPGFYIEVADNSTRDHYIQNEKEGRKKIGVIQEFPYTTLREATRDEYIHQKTEGDKIMRERRARIDG